MKILLDTNIVLDLLLDREPFVNSAKIIFEYIECGLIEGYLSASSITTLHYLITKSKSKKVADDVVIKLLKLFKIANLNKDILHDATVNNGSDYEDSVIYTSGEYAQIDYIITRDKRGFKNSKVSILEPDNFIAFYSNL